MFNPSKLWGSLQGIFKLTIIFRSCKNHFNLTTLTREELDSSNKVTKKTVALMSLLQDQICFDEEIKRKPIAWETLSDTPIGRKEKKGLRQFNKFEIVCNYGFYRTQCYVGVPGGTCQSCKLSERKG